MQESGTEAQRIEKEIFGHPVIRENPYLEHFARVPSGPTDAEVKDLIIQLGTFSQEVALIRVGRKMYVPYPYPRKQCGGCSTCVARNDLKGNAGAPRDGGSREDESAYAAWLNAAAALILDAEKDLKGEVFGVAALASRETVHAIHQLERTYGSENKQKSAGARFALGVWAGIGIDKEVPAGENFFSEILKGIERYNSLRRVPNGLSLVPTASHAAPFLSERRFVVDALQKTVNCAHHSRHTAEWFFGAKIALDAIEMFWFGLNKRRHTLK